MNFELNEILTIIDKVKTTGLDSFEYQDTDVKLKIRGQKVESGKGIPVALDERNAGAVTVGSAKEGMDSDALFVESPMVGTFYHAPSEDAAPFISVGDKISKGQVIGIIEAMKLMNEIPSEVDGIVEEILVDNETIVEFGQPLVRVRKEMSC